MEGLKPIPKAYFTLIVTILFTVLVSSAKGQIGQINMPCTSSMISRFTPCMDFITGSTADGSSPTLDCCDAFESLMSTSMDCGCMLVTASIPLPLGYIKRNLALSLPRLCGTNDVAVRCQAAASPRSAPGCKQLEPPTPPNSALSSQASKAKDLAPAVDDDDDDEPTAKQEPEASPPVAVEAPSATSLFGLLPRSTSSTPSMISSHTIWLLLMGFLVLKLL